MNLSQEQQRNMLEAAAKACGVTLEREISGKKPHRLIEHESGEGRISVPWNPRAIALDTAEMCAELGIGTRWYLLNDCVVCGPSYSNVTAYFKDHDNSRLKAWMWAATMCAAKIGGYE